MYTKQNAFTLIELLVTLVVLAVVMAMTMPSFNKQITANQSSSLAGDISTALHLVRSEAIKLSGRVSLCASTNGTTCSNDANNWVKGFIAVIDTATSDSATSAVAGTVLRAWGEQDSRAVMTVKAGSPASAVATSFVRYTGMGILGPASGITIDVYMKDTNGVCIPNSRQKVTVGVGGTIAVSRPTCP